MISLRKVTLSNGPDLTSAGKYPVRFGFHAYFSVLLWYTDWTMQVWDFGKN